MQQFLEETDVALKQQPKEIQVLHAEHGVHSVASLHLYQWQQLKVAVVDVVQHPEVVDFLLVEVAYLQILPQGARDLCDIEQQFLEHGHQEPQQYILVPLVKVYFPVPPLYKHVEIVGQYVVVEAELAQQSDVVKETDVEVVVQHLQVLLGLAVLFHEMVGVVAVELRQQRDDRELVLLIFGAVKDVAEAQQDPLIFAPRRLIGVYPGDLVEELLLENVPLGYLHHLAAQEVERVRAKLLVLVCGAPNGLNQLNDLPLVQLPPAVARLYQAHAYMPRQHVG